MIITKKIITLASAVALSLSVTACDLSTPSRLNIGKITVSNKIVSKSFDLSKIDEPMIREMVDDIKTAGEDSATINISYFKGDDSNMQLMMQEAKVVKEKFISFGVHNVSVVSIPVDEQRNIGKLVIYYKTKVAEAPDECTEMVGIKGAGDNTEMEDYSVGCSYKTAVSKMIADPDDLLGYEKASDIESRRVGATVEKYKAGVPNEKINGYSASDYGK